MRKEKKIYLFDLDDTLITTDAKIRVLSLDKKLLYSLTPQEFNSYDRTNKNHLLDFDDFNSVEILLNAKFIEENVQKLRRLIHRNYPIAIITARGYHESIVQFFHEKNLRIPSEMIFAVNDERFPHSGNVAERKQKAIKDLIKKGFNSFVFYDDDLNNLKKAKELETQFNVKVKTIKV